jgi:hypothetical protein
MEEMVTATSQWAQVSRDLHHLEPLPEAELPGLRLRHACRCLLRHDDRVLRLSVAARYVTTMGALAERTTALLQHAKADPVVGHPERSLASRRQRRRGLVVSGR